MIQGMAEDKLSSVSAFRWWDDNWLMQEFYWPLIEAGETRDIYSMTLTQLRLHVNSLSSYQQMKNFSSWVSMDMAKDSSNGGSSGDSSSRNEPKSRIGNVAPEGVTYADWNIKGAAEFDMFYLPSCGTDENWAKHGYSSI